MFGSNSDFGRRGGYFLRLLHLNKKLGRKNYLDKNAFWKSIPLVVAQTYTKEMSVK